MVSEPGDDLETVNRSRRASVPVGEDDDDGVTAGLLVSCVLTETMYATSVELPDKWGGEGRPLGMAVVSCALRVCSGGCGERARAVGRGQRGGGVGEGVLGVSRRGLGRGSGLQREAGGGGLRGCARVFAPAYWQEEDDERGGKWAGPARWSGQLPGQVGCR